jgi:hypothetical protein
MIAVADQDEQAGRWPITQEIRDEVVSRLMQIVTGPSAPEAIRAARLLLAADELNLASEKLQAELRSQCLEILHQRKAGAGELS